MPHDIFTTIETAIKETTGVTDTLLGDGGEHADLATTVAFALAKQKKQAPVKIAQEIVADLKKRPDLSGRHLSSLVNYTPPFSFVKPLETSPPLRLTAVR